MVFFGRAGRCIESSSGEVGYSMFNWQLSNVQRGGEKESHERADWKEGKEGEEGEPLRQQTSWMRGVKGREG